MRVGGFTRVRASGILLGLSLLLGPTDSEARGSSAVRGSSAARGGSAKTPALTEEERDLLFQGASVKRQFIIHRNGTRYHAGLSYRLVRARPLDVLRALRAPGGIAQVLPYGISATTHSEEAGVAKIRVRQGKPPVVGSYTVRLVWDLAKYEAKFWLDPSERADVRDIWGVFQAREVSPGVTLVSFGFAFDIGGIGALLEKKAQGWALQVPDRLSDMIEVQSQDRGRFPGRR